MELITIDNADYIASSCWQLNFYLFLERVLAVMLIET